MDQCCKNVCRTCPLELLWHDIVKIFRMSEPPAWEDVRSASCEVPHGGPVLPGALRPRFRTGWSPDTATGFVPFSVNLTMPDHLIHPEAGN